MGRYLSSLCVEHQAAILLIHHTRKMGSDDPIDLISGTLGLAGGVDGFMVLQRMPFGDAATLYVAGRDIEEAGEHAGPRQCAVAAHGGGSAAGASGARAASRGHALRDGARSIRELAEVLNPGPCPYPVRNATPSTRPFPRSSTSSGIRGLSSNGPLTVGGALISLPLLLLEPEEADGSGVTTGTAGTMEPLELLENGSSCSSDAVEHRWNPEPLSDKGCRDGSSGSSGSIGTCQPAQFGAVERITGVPRPAWRGCPGHRRIRGWLQRIGEGARDDRGGP